ncbi:MAG: hypothetical protein WCR19_05785 [Acholeplasmataceae bacterium]
MIERLRILTLLQLSNKTKLYGKNSKRIYAVIALRALILLLITIAMSFVLYFIKSILYIPVNIHFMIFIFMATQLTSIVSATVGLMMDLFQSKDNQILFSLPVKNDEIFLSKLIVYYIYELQRSLYILFPFMVSYGYISNFSFSYYVQLIPLIIMMPFIVVFFSSFISIFAVAIRNFLKKYNMVSFLITLVFIGFVFFLTYKVVSNIETPIRLVQMYRTFIINLSLFMQNVSKFGLIYNQIAEALYLSQVFLNYVIIIAVVVFLFFINIWISKPLFFRLTSKTLETTVLKNHKIMKAKKTSLFFTFFKKEWIIAKRSPNELLNNYALLLSLPFFMYILNYIYMGMNRSTLGNQFVLIFNVLIVLLITTASNTASATAITTEGFEFVLLKTAPSNTSKVAWAKIAFNLIFTNIIILLSFILFNLALPIFDSQTVWLLFIFVILVNSGHIFWSFQLDILNPKLSDYAATGSLSNNDNVSKSISIGLVLSLGFAILSLALFIFIAEIAWIVLIVLAILFLMLRFYLFRVYLKAYFVDIEY